MKRAAVLLNPSPTYRRDAFAAGLQRHGYDVRFDAAHSDPRAGDVLVIWNRYPRSEPIARRYEDAGGVVLVTENAWVGPEDKAEHHFALCRGHHCGAGTWEVGPTKRWPKLGIELKPWRERGEHVVVLPQRGLGEPGIAMPQGWGENVSARLERSTKRAVKLRGHPGKRPHPPLEPDLLGAHCAVVWASGAGIKAIIAGIPVFHELPQWIGAPAAKHGIADIEAPFLGDREPMLERLAWAQWSPSEIASGEPFEWLLR